MKKLFEALPRTEEHEVRERKSVLLDTCFLVYVFEHHRYEQLQKLTSTHVVLVTSFNIEELDHIKHKLHDDVREAARHYFKKQPQISVIELPVSPGDRSGERAYIQSVDPELLKDVDDPSDAVLMAAAIETHSDVLTRDKHHLFTAKLENYVKKYGLKVEKNAHEL